MVFYSKILFLRNPNGFSEKGTNYRKVFLAERKGKVYDLQIVEKGAN
jgi:hypothetical protein